MKNRGYTLLELLGVIVILALLTTLVFPSILNSIKESSDDADKLSMNLIDNAVDLYIENHANDFKKRNGSRFIIEMNELIEDGNLPSNIKISDIDSIEEKCIQVIYINNKYMYELKNEGTCEHFIALPEEYQQVEYIESTGAQYINTQISYSSSKNYKIETRGICEATGYSGSGWNAGGWFGVDKNNLNWSDGVNFTQLPANNLTDIVLEINQTTNQTTTKFTQGTVTETIVRSNSSMSSYAQVDYPIFSLTSSDVVAELPYQGYVGKIYYLKFYSDNTIVRDFIPCYRKLDGVIGMYDLVEDKFYTNLGTGTFVKGKDI